MPAPIVRSLSAAVPWRPPTHKQLELAGLSVLASEDHMKGHGPALRRIRLPSRVRAQASPAADLTLAYW